MESKERVLTVLDHRESDRVPIQAWFVPQLKRALEQKYGAPDDDLYVLLGNDILSVTFGMSTGFYKEDSPSYVDDYGITYKNTGVYTELAGHPLDTDEKAWRFVPPPVNRDAIVSKTKRLIERYGRTHAIAGKINQTLFESSWMLRGLERFLMDLIEDPELADHLMTKMMEHHLEIGKVLVASGVDIVYTGDDVGTQRGMSISPELFRKMLKPKYAYLWGELKKINPGVKIAHHTCGNVAPIVPDYIEAGLDILNPIQPKAMNGAELKSKYGRHLCFWGGMDIQETLPFGRREDIFREVRDRMKTLGPGGGFIIAPAHNIQIDTSVENVESFYEAARQFGKYPIRI